MPVNHCYTAFPMWSIITSARHTSTPTTLARITIDVTDALCPRRSPTQSSASSGRWHAWVKL